MCNEDNTRAPASLLNEHIIDYIERYLTIDNLSSWTGGKARHGTEPCW